MDSFEEMAQQLADVCDDYFLDDVEASLLVERVLDNEAMAPVVQYPDDVVLPPPGTTRNLRRRIQGLKFALTYPVCSMEPDVALAAIIANPILSGLGFEHIVVAQELHQDGQKHLHVSIVLSLALRMTDDGSFFDFITGQHGNYQQTRSVFKWLKYILKDNRLISSHPDSFDPLQALKDMANHVRLEKHQISSAIVDGKRSLKDFVATNATYLMLNSRKMQSLMTICDDNDNNLRVFPAFPLLVPMLNPILNASCVQVLEWLLSVFQGTFGRTSSHLRISAETGAGKTYLSFLLSQFTVVYNMPDEKWLDSFDDGDQRLVIFDEYKAQKTIQFLNQFSDGANYPCPRRGVRPFLHSVKTPCLMLTNYSWIEAYPRALGTNESLLATVERRWIDVNFSGPDTLMPLCRYLQSLLPAVD